MAIHDIFLIKLCAYISFLIVTHGHPLDLELMISIDDGFEAARGGISRAIKNFNSTSGVVKFSHDTVTLTDDLNKTQLCGDLIKLRKPLIVIEARRKPLMHRNTLKLMARNIRIPMMSASLDDYMMQIDEEWISLDSKENQFLISFQPLSIAMMRSILNVAPHFNIKNGVVFHEEFSDQPLKCLMKQNKSLNLTSVRIESRDIDDMARVLKIRKKEKYTQFIIIASSRTINLFLESFRRNDLFRKPYILIAISKDQGKIKCTLCKHGQLIIVKPSKSIYEYDNDIPDQTSTLPIDQSIEFYFFYDITRLLLRSVERIVERGQWKSLPITEACALRETNSNDNSFTPLLEYMKSESEDMFGRFGRFRYSSLIGENHRPEFFYQEIGMRISQQNYRASGHTEKKLAQWENQLPAGLVLQTAKLEDEDEEGGDEDEDDKVIKVVLYLSPPFVMKRIVNGSSEPIYEGFLMDLFNEIKRILGDKMPEYELEETTVKSMGIVEQFEEEVDIEAPGLTGLLRDMQDNELKGFVLAPMTITESRELIVDFSEPIFDQVGISVLMKKPERQSQTWRFITVLEKGVWASITGAYFFTSILLAIFDRYSPYSYRNKPEKYVDEEDKRIFTFKETLWFCFISLTPQGGGDAPKCISGRLVAAIWWLLGFVFTASYTANLAAFLTVSRLENHVDNMATLSKQYKIRYAPVESSAADAYFTEMAYIEDKYYEIWKNLSLDDDLSEDQRANLAVWEYPISDRYTKIKAQMVEATKPKSVEEGVRRVRASNSTDHSFAFLTDSLDVEYFTFLYCDLFKAGDDFGYHPIALPIAKETKINIKKLIDPIIRQLKDNGFIENLRVKYWFTDKRRTGCPEYRILSNGLSLFNTYGMFTVLGIGMIFTLAVINIENWVITLWQRKEAKSQTVKHIAVVPKS